jgi:hypothetical protein
LGSFESQKLYHEEKISSNPDWINAGIFADEAITGTKTDKAQQFGVRKAGMAVHERYQERYCKLPKR